MRISQTASIALLYFENYPDEALHWARQLPTEESGKALAVVVRTIAERAPGEAEEMVLSLVDPDVQAATAASFLGDWAWRRGRPAAAYEWSVRNLTTAVRRKANQGLFVGWATIDPVAAAATMEIADPDIYHESFETFHVRNAGHIIRVMDKAFDDFAAGTDDAGNGTLLGLGGN